MRDCIVPVDGECEKYGHPHYIRTFKKDASEIFEVL